MLYCLQFALLHDLAMERVRFSLAFFLVFLRSSFLFWHFLLVSGLANVYDRCHIPIPLLSFAFFTSMLDARELAWTLPTCALPFYKPFACIRSPLILRGTPRGGGCYY